MAGMDIFKADGFSMMSLTTAVNKIPTVPQFLGSLNLFTPEPARTAEIAIDTETQTIGLIPVSERNAPRRREISNARSVRKLETTALQDGFRMYAEEIAGIRAHGSDSELESIQAEVLKREAKIKRKMDLTHENHRLGAIQGKVLDADGSSVIYNYFTEFGDTEADAVSFELDVATTNVRGVTHSVTRAMRRASSGSITPATTIHALCGDSFYDALLDHPNVRDAFKGHAQAGQLLEDKAFQSFAFAGGVFHNYQGTDDNSTVAIATNEAKFFPQGAQDFFVKAMAPHGTFEFVNTPGRDYYAEMTYEYEGNSAKSRYVDFDLYSYPLYICTKPGALRKATLT